MRRDRIGVLLGALGAPLCFVLWAVAVAALSFVVAHSVGLAVGLLVAWVCLAVTVFVLWRW